jgi:hypothetical protein
MIGANQTDPHREDAPSGGSVGTNPSAIRKPPRCSLHPPARQVPSRNRLDGMIAGPIEHPRSKLSARPRVRRPRPGRPDFGRAGLIVWTNGLAYERPIPDKVRDPARSPQRLRPPPCESRHWSDQRPSLWRFQSRMQAMLGSLRQRRRPIRDQEIHQRPYGRRHATLCGVREIDVDFRWLPLTC